MKHQTEKSKLWLILVFVVFLGFTVLIQQLVKLYHVASPVPDTVVTEAEDVLHSLADVLDGQNLWHSMGGQELGSAWRYGAYVAPDWTAGWLHRECLYTHEHLLKWSFHRPYVSLAPAEQPDKWARLVQEFRANTHDEVTGGLTFSQERVEDAKAVTRYYSAIFTDVMEFDADTKPFVDAGKSPRELREAHAVANNTLERKERLRKLGAFFFLGMCGSPTSRSSKRNRAYRKPTD